MPHKKKYLFLVLFLVFNILPLIQAQPSPTITTTPIQAQNQKMNVNPSIPIDMGVNTLHSLGFKGQNITIAVLDSGIDANDSRFIREDNTSVIERSVSFLEENGTIYEDEYDYNGHGTIVSGLIGSVYSDVVKTWGPTGAPSPPSRMGGIAPNATLWSLKVLDGEGSGSIQYLINALEYVYMNRDKIDIISLSLGALDMEIEPLSDVIDRCIDAGIFILSAAGNEGGTDKPHFYTIATPSNHLRVLSVGNVIDNTYIASSSSNGPTRSGLYKPEIMVPGTLILSTYLNNSHAYSSGTSLSTPIAVGALACILSGLHNRSQYSYEDIIISILQSSELLDDYIDPYMQGVGIPNFYQAWQSLINKNTKIASVPTQFTFPNIFASAGEFREYYKLDYMRATIVVSERLAFPLSIELNDTLESVIVLRDLDEILNSGYHVLGVDFKAPPLFTLQHVYEGSILFYDAEFDLIYTIEITCQFSTWFLIRRHTGFILIFILAIVSVLLIIEYRARNKNKLKIIEKLNDLGIIQCPKKAVCECDPETGFCKIKYVNQKLTLKKNEHINL